MLKDCLEVFEKKLQKEGEGIILDAYIPTDGTYVLVESNNHRFEVTDVVNIKQDKKTLEVDGRYNSKYEDICFYDYNSKLLTANKPIDKKKKIHSNNYLSFFIKKDNLDTKVLTDEIIDGYYDTILNLDKKYSSKTDKLIYDDIIKEIGEVNSERVEEIKKWIKENIFELKKFNIDVSGKDYLKIFFIYQKEDFAKEGKRYFIPNIYNTNKYNVKIDDKVYGLPNDNLGMNEKKPYLQNKSRKIVSPYLLDLEQVQLQKKLFDYFATLVAVKKYNVYVDYDKQDIFAYTNEKSPDSDFNGAFFRLQKGMEIQIEHFDVICHYSNKLKTHFKFDNILEEDSSKVEYKLFTKLNELQQLVNDVFFSKCLSTNYFTDSKDMLKGMDSLLKKNILLYRDALFNYFYKGNDYGIQAIFDKLSEGLVKDSLAMGYSLKASVEFNLRCSLKNYFDGGINMADVVLELKQKLREKINSEQENKIDSDEEFYFAVGQLVNYFISLSKASRKPHSLINSFLNETSGENIKNRLRILYKNYNYQIENSKRFKKLYLMILGYEIKGKNNEDMIIAGFLSKSLIYEKEEK